MSLPHPHTHTHSHTHTTHTHTNTRTHTTHAHRNVSIGNIYDYSSGDSSTGQEVRRSRIIRRRRNLKPSAYRSEEDLFTLEDDPMTPLRVKSMYNINNMRVAGSLVDLMTSYNGDDAMRNKVRAAAVSSVSVLVVLGFCVITKCLIIIIITKMNA